MIIKLNADGKNNIKLNLIAFYRKSSKWM